MERGLIKDKRAMLFVLLFKVRSCKQNHPLLRTCTPFFVPTQARVETYCGVWSRDGIQAQAAVRRDGRAARGATLLEAHVEPHRCGGVACRSGAGVGRGEQGGV